MTSDVKWRVGIFLGSIVMAILFLLPTVLPDYFKGSMWISKPLSLGLDLKGGVHLLYEVQTDEAVKSRLQTSANSIRSELRNQKIAVLKATSNDQGQVEILLASNRRTDEAKRIIEDTFGRDVHYVDRVADGERDKLIFGISETQRDRIKAESVTQAVETLRNRVDTFGVAEPLIQRIGTNRIMLQMPGVTDIESVKRVVGSVAKLEFRLIPTGATRATAVTMKDADNKPVSVEDQALMTGDAVDNARVSVTEGPPEVLLALNSEGARTFRRITTENVGRNLAIILDGVVRSSPVIREPITGGHASISGGFSIKEAQELSIVLKAGALPAPLKSLEERTVGPTLGRESIQKGVTAMLIGFAMIVAFMVVYYGKAGGLAVGTLLLNGFFLMACLSAFGATLTLPGLAGLALTIGMAVDSNVIIFERIRDELKNGAGRDAAVFGGFNKAYSAIFDSNITTLLTAVILYALGSGPIRGFAVTLSVGILTTMYSAIFVSRLGFDLLPLRGRKEISI